MHHVLDILLRERSGATMVEYGLIAAGISVAIVGALTLVGTEVFDTFAAIAEAVDTSIQN